MFRILLPLSVVLVGGATVIPGTLGAEPMDRLSDQEIAAQLVGEWQSASFGQQVFRARPDGTATIQMRLSTMAAVLYGRHVTLELEWAVVDGQMKQRIVGGSPRDSVEKLIRRYGESHTFDLLDIHSDHIVIADITKRDNHVRWER